MNGRVNQFPLALQLGDELENSTYLTRVPCLYFLPLVLGM